MFDHISKHLKVRQKYSAARRIVNSLLGVWECRQTRSLVFDILHQWLTCLTYGIGLVAYLLTIMSISSCMVPPFSPLGVLLSCSTTQGSRATSDILPAPAQDRASPTVNCSSTWRICSPKQQTFVINNCQLLHYCVRPLGERSINSTRKRTGHERLAERISIFGR